jgi:hypothetical protein
VAPLASGIEAEADQYALDHRKRARQSTDIRQRPPTAAQPTFELEITGSLAA